MSNARCNRRDILKGSLAMSAGAGLASTLPIGTVLASESVVADKKNIGSRVIPSSGEQIPMLGLGTSRVLDVPSNAESLAPLQKVLKVFYDRGGRLIDSSPMYGNSEAVTGIIADALGLNKQFFMATKVWIDGQQAGVEQMQMSAELMRKQPLDLIQIHNLLDWKAHLQTLRQWKEEGKVRYIGITHYREAAHDELVKIIRSEELDFVQFNYNLLERGAEKTLLPLVQERGVATLINRPFARAQLFRMTKGEQLPEWAAEFDCRSWAQFFLKFVLGHPGVTCAIPATSKVHHMHDNMSAGVGEMPTEKQRIKMAEFIQNL